MRRKGWNINKTKEDMNLKNLTHDLTSAHFFVYKKTQPNYRKEQLDKLQFLQQQTYQIQQDGN